MAKDFSALLDELKGYDFSGMYNADFLHTWDKTTDELRALYAVDLHIVPHPRNGLPQALPLRPRGPEYREDSPHDA